MSPLPWVAPQPDRKWKTVKHMRLNCELETCAATCLCICHTCVVRLIRLLRKRQHLQRLKNMLMGLDIRCQVFLGYLRMEVWLWSLALRKHRIIGITIQKKTYSNNPSGLMKTSHQAEVRSCWDSAPYLSSFRWRRCLPSICKTHEGAPAMPDMVKHFAYPRKGLDKFRASDSNSSISNYTFLFWGWFPQ